jgi:hypothetical protein
LAAGVIDPHELATLRAEFERLLASAPATEGGAVAADGRPAFEPAGHRGPWWSWADALGDPTGGRGRAAARMRRHLTPVGVAMDSNETHMSC